MSTTLANFREFTGDQFAELSDEHLLKIVSVPSFYVLKGRWTLCAPHTEGSRRFEVLPGTDSFRLDPVENDDSTIHLTDYQTAYFSKKALAHHVFKTGGSYFVAYDGGIGKKDVSPYIYSHKDFVQIAYAIHLTRHSFNGDRELAKLDFVSVSGVWYHKDQQPYCLTKTLLAKEGKLSLYLIPGSQSISYAVYRNDLLIEEFSLHTSAFSLFNRLRYSELKLLPPL